MNRTHYLGKELVFRRGRSIATMLSIGVSVLAAVLLISVATTYSKAIQAPMKSVGADIVAQLSGDIPRALEGLVFSHPNALLPAASVGKSGSGKSTLLGLIAGLENMLLPVLYDDKMSRADYSARAHNLLGRLGTSDAWLAVGRGKG